MTKALLPLPLSDAGAEGRQSELGYLEELLPKGDADDRDAPKAPDQEVAQSHPPTTGDFAIHVFRRCGLRYNRVVPHAAHDALLRTLSVCAQRANQEEGRRERHDKHHQA